MLRASKKNYISFKNMYSRALRIHLFFEFHMQNVSGLFSDFGGTVTFRQICWGVNILIMRLIIEF